MEGVGRIGKPRNEDRVRATEEQRLTEEPTRTFGGRSSSSFSSMLPSTSEISACFMSSFQARLDNASLCRFSRDHRSGGCGAVLHIRSTTRWVCCIIFKTATSLAKGWRRKRFFFLQMYCCICSTCNKKAFFEILFQKTPPYFDNPGIAPWLKPLEEGRGVQAPLHRRRSRSTSSRAPSP